MAGSCPAERNPAALSPARGTPGARRGRRGCRHRTRPRLALDRLSDHENDPARPCLHSRSGPRHGLSARESPPSRALGGDCGPANCPVMTNPAAGSQVNHDPPVHARPLIFSRGHSQAQGAEVANVRFTEGALRHRHRPDRPLWAEPTRRGGRLVFKGRRPRRGSTHPRSPLQGNGPAYPSSCD